MSPDDSWTVARRVEPGLKATWGLYSVRHDRWLDMVFSSEREVAQSLRILSGKTKGHLW